MEISDAIQILSFGILYGAAAVLLVDFLNARRQLTRALADWRSEQESA